MATNTETAELPRDFGQWLLGQIRRSDAVGALAKCASADPRFPSGASPRDVWRRLNELEADSDMLAAMEEAEADWRALQ